MYYGKEYIYIICLYIILVEKNKLKQGGWKI